MARRIPAPRRTRRQFFPVPLAAAGTPPPTPPDAIPAIARRTRRPSSTKPRRGQFFTAPPQPGTLPARMLRTSRRPATARRRGRFLPVPPAQQPVPPPLRRRRTPPRTHRPARRSVFLKVPNQTGATFAAPITFTADLAGGVPAITPVTVRKPVKWRMFTGPATGGFQQELTAAQGRKFTARLTEASGIDFAINGRHPQAANIDGLTTDGHLLWVDTGGTIHRLFRGRFGAQSHAGEQTKQVKSQSALDYRSLLSRRDLYSDSQLTWTGVDQAEIAWGLINQTQTRTGGDLGISKAWTTSTPTGQLRDRTYEAGDKIGERVQELSEVINGFDWDILPVSQSALQFNVYYPQRGSYRGVVLQYGGLVTTYKREVQPGEYGNALRYTGADGLTPVELEAADLASRPEGRWDLVFGDTGLLTQQALADRAAWQLAQSQVIDPVYTLRLRRDAWEGPDHIWLGDAVRIVIFDGELRVNTVQRVHEMSFSIDQNGGADIEITTGGPKPDPARKAVAIDRKLANLARR